jgi:cold-inducible RNA-binding protein
VVICEPGVWGGSVTDFVLFMKLFVGNLSFATVENDLRDLFSQYGSVTDVHVATDRMSGRSRGFAFVTMGSKAEGEAAIKALEGQTLDGRNLSVNEARPKTERPDRDFRRR